MPNTTFLTWRKFNDPGLARATAEHLSLSGIPYEIEDNTHLFEPSFAFNNIEPDIALKLSPDTFSLADACMYDHYKQLVEEAPLNHYLFSFSDKELRDILAKPDEWGHFDYLLAQKILTERGPALSEEQLTALQDQRMEDLAQPATAQPFWLLISYIAALLLVPVGIFFGLALACQKKSLPNGKRIYAYDRQSRKHGWTILSIAIATTAFRLGKILYLSYEVAG